MNANSANSESVPDPTRSLDSIDPTETVELPPRVPELSTIKCPSCDATLQKVAITTGVKINCLHCGARFFPPSVANPAGAGDAVPVGEVAKPKTREPQSPGYWLLRVPAVIVLVAGIFITALITWFGLHDFRPRLENLWAATYVPLIALAGAFAFLWSRALARIDAGMTHRFWMLGLLREPLPPMPGSSLPYIGPLAIVGGCYPVFIFAFETGSPDEVIFGTLIGALLFLLGFMAEDIRQFAWREHTTAEKIEPPSELDRHRPYGNAVYSWTGLACAGGFGGFGLLWSYVAYNYWTEYTSYTWYRSNIVFFTCMALGFAACAATGFKLCSDGDRAVASWMRVAARLRRRNAALSGSFPVPPEFRPQGFAAMVRWLPIAWALYGIVFLMGLALDNLNSGVREANIWIMVVVGSAFAVLWFSLMILQVSRWRQAKQTACALLLKEELPAATPKVTGWPGAVFKCATVIALIEAGLMLCVILENVSRRMEWELFFAIPLFLGMAHYPVLWISTLTREFVALEQDVAPDGKSDEQ